MNKLLVLLTIFFILPFTLLAQSKTIKGRVTDENGAPIAGANVIVTTSKKGVQTDKDGNFSIDVSATGTVELSISSVGYGKRTVTVTGTDAGNVRLIKDVVSGDEVVVIGYGTAKKKDITGATSSLSGTALEKIPLSSVAESMTGRLPGVAITTTDGAPGADIIIRVRGGGSVSYDNSPLYIVDGFPVSSLNDVAPTDIASIDILKDASSTAIYGARGANGVVIITTKSAKGGKTAINFNSFFQTRQLPKKLDVLSPYEFALMQYEYGVSRGGSDFDNFTKYYGVYDDLELYRHQKPTDWQDVLFGSSGNSQQHSISVTGGTDKTKFSFSATNNKDKGLQPTSGYQRNYMNFKLNHEISRVLKLDFTTRYTNTTIDGAGTNSGSVKIGDGITTRPINGLADYVEIDPSLLSGSVDDYEQFIKGLISPVALTEQDYRKNLTNTFNTNLGVSWNVLKSLVYRTEFGINLSWNNTRRYYGPLTGESKTNGNSLPVAEIRNNKSFNYRWLNTLTYTFKRGNHDLNVLAGQELTAGRISNDYSRFENFAENLSPQKIFANVALGIPDQFSTFEGSYENIASFFGRANYQFKGKYIFTATARYDGSVKFAPGKKWGLFPAFAAAWRISAEPFMENVNFVNDLKLRLSYGISGNNRIDDNLYRRLYGIQTNRGIGFNEVNQAYWGVASDVLINPDIQWENTTTRNLGLDFGLFGNKLTGTIDAYYNNVPNLLVKTSIPPQTGYKYQIRNQGETSNKGIELALTGNIINKKNFTFGANFNIGFNRSKIVSLGGPDWQEAISGWASTDLKTREDYRLYVGKSVGLMYGYVTDGMYTTDDFESYDPVSHKYKLKAGVADDGALIGVIGGSVGSASTVRPGILKLKDLDGDGFVTAADRQIIGDAQAKFQGGFGINTAFKGIDLSLFFNYSVGNDVYNSGKIQFNMFYRNSFGNLLDVNNYDNRFKYIDASGKLVNDLAQLKELNKNATMWTPLSMGTASPVFHSYAVEDGSFLRLNNVTIGYTIPKSVTSKALMNRVRFYGTVTNVFILTNYSGYDPEVTTRAGNNFTPGLDYSGYPKSRTFTVGANVTF